MSVSATLTMPDPFRKTQVMVLTKGRRKAHNNPKTVCRYADLMSLLAKCIPSSCACPNPLKKSPNNVRKPLLLSENGRYTFTGREGASRSVNGQKLAGTKIEI